MEPVVFRFGEVELHAYTVCMLSAILLGGGLAYREAKRRWRLSSTTMLVGSAGVAGGILGAKLGMIMFLGPRDFFANIEDLPFHGATITGALMGGYLSVVIAERLLKVDRCIGDLVAPFIPLSQAIGRLGNFLAVDAYGTESGLPWAITQAGARRHPVQLYEMALDLLLFAYLLRKRKTSYKDGELWKIYVFGYALIRFPMEFLRYQPTPQDFLGLTLVQWLCIGAVTWFVVQWLGERRAKPKLASAHIAAGVTASRERANA